MTLISISELRRVLRHDPISGEMFWNRRSDVCRSWNTRFADKPALNAAHGAGYLQGSVFGKRCFAHRAIWALHYGAWPTHFIDHKDGVRSNNSIKNLREANNFENARNRMSKAKSSSSFLGVSWDKENRKWVSQITVSGKNIKIGRFVCEIDAARSYDRFAFENYGDFAKLNFAPTEGRPTANASPQRCMTVDQPIKETT